MGVSRQPDPATLPREIKCRHCPGTRCCTYVTQKIPGPRSYADFDHLRWQVAHAGVECYRDESGWYLMFLTPCRHLQGDGRCGIYSVRPRICREYDNDYCEFDAPAEAGFLVHFRTDRDVDAYCRRRFRHWDRYRRGGE